MTSVEIIRRYQEQYGRLRIGTAARLALLWDRLGGLTDDDVERFTKAAVAHMSGAERATAALVAGYIAQLGRLATGTGRAVAIPPSQVTGEALRGVDPFEVYKRPIVTARTAISKGKTFAEAMSDARNRAMEIAALDIILTQRATTVAVAEKDKRIVGYRRVLTGASCPLCRIASTQRYHKDSLMPIHGHCDCGVAPIFGTEDPGQVINHKLLGEIRDEEAAVAVRHHGELGPVLVDRDDHFTGPRGIAA